MRSEDFFEVVVLVEGVEPYSSSTVQARHSYSFGHDIVVNGNFMPCTFITKDGTTMVDFGKFHQIIRPEEDEEAAHLTTSDKNETHIERIGL